MYLSGQSSLNYEISFEDASDYVGYEMYYFIILNQLDDELDI